MRKSALLIFALFVFGTSAFSQVWWTIEGPLGTEEFAKTGVETLTVEIPKSTKGKSLQALALDFEIFKEMKNGNAKIVYWVLTHECDFHHPTRGKITFKVSFHKYEGSLDGKAVSVRYAFGEDSTGNQYLCIVTYPIGENTTCLQFLIAELPTVSGDGF